MKQTQPSMERAGSLTPELEGAARSDAHSARAPKPARTSAKGGAAHE